MQAECQLTRRSENQGAFLSTKIPVLGATILSNGKKHLGPTDRNDETGRSGPPSKLVPNIPVEPNQSGLFHLMYQPKFPEFQFWVEWKAPPAPSPFFSSFLLKWLL